jgi:predicted ferric reductase
MKHLTLFAATGNITSLSTFFWYTIRVSGFVAIGLLVLTIITGIGRATGILYRWTDPLKAWALHKTLALSMVGAIALHVGLLLVDKVTRFSLAQIAIPGLSTYTNGAAIGPNWTAISAGVVALWLLTAVIVTSVTKVRTTHPKLWRVVHLSSYVAMIAIFLHALGAGTDLKDGFVRAIWMGLLCIFLVVAVWRLGTVLVRKKAIRP